MWTGPQAARPDRIRQFFLALTVVFSCFSPVSSGAQTVNNEIIQELADQGFSVVSTRYTWLRRIVVTASDGTFERELLITRGTGVVLHDKWRRVDTPPQRPRVRQKNDDRDKRHPPPRRTGPRPGDGPSHPPEDRPKSRPESRSGSPSGPPPADKPSPGNR